MTHCWCVIGWHGANVAHNWWHEALCQCGGFRVLLACMMTSPTYESDIIRIGNVPSSNMGTLVHAKQGILFGFIIFSCHFWKHHVKDIHCWFMTITWQFHSRAHLEHRRHDHQGIVEFLPQLVNRILLSFLWDALRAQAHMARFVGFLLSCIYVAHV